MASTISASGNSSIDFSSKSELTAASYGRKAFHEGGHQLEKLEFALAVAETRVDKNRSDLLRAQIADLGGNIEEPGT